jgi:hypothetical protein
MPLNNTSLLRHILLPQEWVYIALALFLLTHSNQVLSEISVSVQVEINATDSNYIISKEHLTEDEVIYFGGENGEVLFSGKIKITASPGQSIRLLPGTKIEADSETTISIVSKESQAVYAEERAKEERAKTVESILRRQETEMQKPLEALLVFRYPLAKRTQTFVRQKLVFLAVLPPEVQVTFPTSVVCNHLFSHIQPFEIPHFSDLNSAGNLPITSWGERGQCIRVMRT